MKSMAGLRFSLLIAIFVCAILCLGVGAGFFYTSPFELRSVLQMPNSDGTYQLKLIERGQNPKTTEVRLGTC